MTFEDGRYHVNWPWKEENPDLPINRELALGRLKSNVSRMRNKPEVMKQYDSIIQDQLEKEVKGWTQLIRTAQNITCHIMRLSTRKKKQQLNFV